MAEYEAKEIPLLTELTGRVLSIDCAAGQVLPTDALIIIVESMKMEIPITAPYDCVVHRVLVRLGDFIEDGQPVAIILEHGD